ncbi:polyketide cyclase [Marinomonas sp. M1K-6]|uniref:Polyketide cyclase n=1 Tax=Marinomonas profundi TaxID=2726122 RepID=A0A847R7P8_9GAMM|nr:polyketide cyclase [Marinomonas profundi]NLQ16964.1 polyketide cyclase [Marinomonas profundi]UDV02689.1 polyketide cyclase [Marinomonas profundi]
MVSNSSHPAALYTLRKVTRVLALLILLLVVVGFFLPTTYQVERQIVINTPRNVVLEKMFQGDFLSRWLFVQNGQVDLFDGLLKAGDSVGLSYDDASKRGELMLVNVSSDRVRFDVRPKEGVNLVQNTIRLQSVGQTTHVQWTIAGDLSAGLLSPYLAVFANSIAGHNFEKSLQQLKTLLETNH